MDAPTPVMLQLDYESIHRHSEFLTQLPFELKIAMPPTDSGNRGYSDKYINRLKVNLSM